MIDVVSHVINALRAGRGNVTRGGKGESVITDCPACGKDEHFAIRVSTGWFICFRCGLRGRADFTDRLIEWRRAVRRPGGVVPPTAGTSGPQDDGGGLYAALSPIPLWTDDAGKPAQEYVRRRGLDRETMRRYKVTADKYGHRVWFPYWNDSGAVTFFMGRTIIEDLEPKTIEPLGSDKPLYGLHVGIAYGREVFAVEGVFDHFATPMSVCTMGSLLYEGQIQQFRALGRRVFLPFDPDAKQKAIVSARRLRKAGVEAAAVILEGTNKDPADLGPSVMLEVVSAVRRMTSGLRVLPQVLTVHVSKHD